MEFGSIVPLLRMFDIPATRAFYNDYSASASTSNTASSRNCRSTCRSRAVAAACI